MKQSFSFAAVIFAFSVFTGCESTDGGGSVSGGVYYGVGFYDPWYYGGYDDIDIDISVPDRPARPEHPIAKPPAASTPRPTPMPSIPSAPRVTPRGGGRR